MMRQWIALGIVLCVTLNVQGCFVAGYALGTGVDVASHGVSTVSRFV